MQTIDEILEGYMNRLQERFWSQVKKSNGCWNWTGSDLSGHQKYGHFNIHKRTMAAHRVAWILTHKFIPKGLHVLHKCDNQKCCNPKHLWLGTNSDNIRDKISKKRHGFGETHSRAILTEKQVREIRSRYIPRKVTETMLSIEYGVSRRNIRSILQRETWRHI
jgi:hypothetical protein